MGLDYCENFILCIFIQPKKFNSYKIVLYMYNFDLYCTCTCTSTKVLTSTVDKRSSDVSHKDCTTDG